MQLHFKVHKSYARHAPWQRLFHYRKGPLGWAEKIPAEKPRAKGFPSHSIPLLTHDRKDPAMILIKNEKRSSIPALDTDDKRHTIWSGDGLSTLDSISCQLLQWGMVGKECGDFSGGETYIHHLLSPQRLDVLDLTLTEGIVVYPITQ